MEKLNQKIRDLLTEYEHNNSEEGVGKMLEVWKENKAGLIAHLSRHPKWDPKNYRIVFQSDYTRDLDTSAITEFGYWAQAAYLKSLPEKTIDGISYDKYRATYDKLTSIQARVEGIRGLARMINNFEANISFVYNGEDYATLAETVDNMEAKLALASYAHVDGAWVTDEEHRNYRTLGNFFNVLTSTESNTLTEELVGMIKNVMPDLNVSVGLRINKAVLRACVKYGLDKVKEIKVTSFTDGNGVTHTRTKDYGFNGRYAELGDKINPLTIKRYTIISVNPMDYLTMSFGHNWASCHTIDKANKRGVGSNHHQGCYCSGTESYMLDSSSLIFYTVDATYDGNEFEYEDKMQRCVFSINNNGTIMIQNRVYPDGRDGGDQSLASQFRAVMQKIVADCYGHNNYWVIKRGTDNCGRHTRSSGTHYRDYLSYNDCTVSLLKGVDADDCMVVEIGHNPICPECGEEHTEEEWLCCDAHNREHICRRCGGTIIRARARDNAIQCVETDHYYCCEECANEDGVFLCVDDDRWHDEDYCYRDDWDDEYYSGDPEIVTEDGLRFSCYDHAYDCGYRETEDGEWYHEDELRYDENRDIYFHEDDDTIIIDGHFYQDQDSAREAGYVDIDGDWYSEDDVVADTRTGEVFPMDSDDAIQIDGNWYINAESALLDGRTEEEVNAA